MGGSGSSPLEEDRSDSAMVVQNLWMSTWRTVDKKADPRKDVIIQTPGWKTVRLYVSSTFEDFALEREALATKVFPELRKWCFERNIYFIDCDLKWGVTKEMRTVEHLEICLQEITRCKEENEECPFLLHMSCSKVGWVPEQREITDGLRHAYGWVDGLSHTEMEVLHAGFRKGSPNAFFAIRKPDFITSMPKDARSAFVDANEMSDNKMMGIRKGIRARFHKEKVLNYTVNYKGQDTDDSVLYGDLEPSFALPIFEYFKRRIETTYPASNQTENCGSSRVSHKQALEEAAAGVKGWEDIHSQLTQHIQDPQPDRLVLLTGGRGTGKSAILAALTQSLQSQSSDKVIFYYNVAAEPSASPTTLLLCSLLQDLHIQVDETSSLEDLCQVAHQALSSTVRTCLLVVDGADQLTDDPTLTWLPRAPPANVCCVLSLDGASVTYTSLHKVSPYSENTANVIEVKVPELNEEAKQAVIEVQMAECDLDLGAAEKETLLQHPGTNNPQWVCIACRELAAGGHVTGKRIGQLPADINSLCVVVLDRLEQEMGRALPVAALCLLYLSTRGLHETELLALLADEENLLPRRRKGTGEFQTPAVDVTDRLTASRWAALYRALRPYLTNYVTSGITRMRLCHAGLGDAIRKRYLTIEDDDESWENQGEEDDTEKIKWWNSKLSCYQGDGQ